MSLLPRGGIGDALTALFRREGIHQEMRRADEARLHGRSGLHSQQLVHQRLVKTAATLRQGFGQDKGLLRMLELHCGKATRIHDGDIGTQPLADGFIRCPHFVFEQLQGQQDTGRERVTPLGSGHL